MNSKRWLLGLVAGVGLCQYGVHAEPVVTSCEFSMHISVNGYTNPPPLPSTSTVTVAVSVAPGQYEGMLADWWAVARGPQGWYYLQPEGWLPLENISALRPARRQALCAVRDFVIFTGSDLPAGDYTCYFGLGEPDADPVRTARIDFELRQVSSWTVFCYMAAVNNLERDFLNKFQDLASIGSDEQIVLLAQLGRGGYAPEFDAWTGSERFVITRGMLPTENYAVTDWGDGHGGREVNTGDPATLKSFLQWGMERYPARNYILMLGNHGFGWRGICTDWSHGSRVIFLSELSATLKEIAGPVDIVLLDACLMQTFETLYDLHLGGVSYALGSQAYSQSDWPYRDMLAGLFANPAWTVRDVAHDIHARLTRHYAEYPDITLALTDLARMPELMEHVDLLADVMIRPELPLADLQARAQSVMNAMDRVVIAEYHGSDWDDRAHGVSIYFPLREFDFVYHAPDSFYFYTQAVCSWAGSMWRDFLELYFTGTKDASGRYIRGEIMDIRADMPACFDQQQEHMDLYGFCARVAAYAP